LPNPRFGALHRLKYERGWIAILAHVGFAAAASHHCGTIDTAALATRGRTTVARE
jgi:hypothetical protein